MPNWKWICTIFLVVSINSPRNYKTTNACWRDMAKRLIFFIQIWLAGFPYTTVRAFWIKIRGDITKIDSPLSIIQGVADSAYQYYRESPKIPHNVIRRFTDSTFHRYWNSPTNFIFGKLSVSMIRRGVESLYRWYDESSIWGVGDSPYHW